MSILLLSPITGWVAGLEETPDAAFSGGALGDGVAIDPTEGVLCAPCDGVVVTLPATRHAIALKSGTGAEILMHVGIDSVALKGEGFQAHAIVGQAVRAGERLITFDIEAVARGARSLLTPVLVTNGERFEVVRRAQGLLDAGEVLLELRERVAAPAEAAAAKTGASRTVSTQFITGLADGVHARPAARIVTAARGAGVEITVGAHGRTASAISALGLMGLGVQRGDAITLWADEAQAPGAFAALREAFEALAGTFPEPLKATTEARVLLGTRGAPGMAMGEAFRYEAAALEIPAHGGAPAAEARALADALAAVRDRLGRLADDASPPRSDILRAHVVLLGDPALYDDATAAIDGGASAGAAWRTAIRRQAELFAVGDLRLRQRRADLLDLEGQVLAELYGTGAEPPKPPSGCIVLADELLPSQLAALADQSIGGVAMGGGGPTSHVAIMAAALGLPTLTAVTGLSGVADGTQVILDADNGRLIVAPTPSAIAEMQARRQARLRRRAAALITAPEPCVTADGRRIAIYANLGSAEEAEPAVAEGAEGCGLLRSEFLFHDRASAPEEEEQRAAYQAVADRLGGRHLTIRTLDIGADKPAPYMAFPPEQNPALGLRGVRAGLWRPEVLRTQLRAILRVHGDISILIPMVTSRHEIAAVRRLLDEEAASMGVAAPSLGVMVETPAAALTVRALSEEADFFSIGANDLTQYALAMDRTLPALAAQFDGLHPAVVTLIRMAAGDAVRCGRKVSVCGGLAADRAAIPLLIGLGVTELSMPAGEIAEAKALIRTLSAADCRTFAESEATYEDSASLRHALAHRWPQVGDGA